MKAKRASAHVSSKTSNKTSSDQERIALLERELLALTARVSKIESRGASDPSHARVSSGDDLAHSLRDRRGAPYEKKGIRGAIVYAGAVMFGEREALWEVERPLPSLFAFRPESIASILAAVGSAPRLALLRLLLAGPKSSQELQEALGYGSPGPLYHHLKELLALDIIEQPERASYRVPARRVVPLLAVISAGMDLGRAALPPGESR